MKDKQKKILIGLSFFNHTKSYLWGKVNYFAHIEAQEKGIDLLVKDADYSLDLQIQQIKNLVENKIDALIIAAKTSDDPQLITQIDQLLNAGIPVIALDSEIGNGRYTCMVSADNINCQQTIATYIFEQLQGKGKVAYIQGNPKLRSAKLRTQGFHNALAQYPGIELVYETHGNYLYPLAFKIMSAFLKTEPELDAIIAANDLTAGAVIAALKNTKRTKFPLISGFDAHYKALIAIQQGELSATARYDAQEFAELSIDMALRALHGEMIPKQKFMNVFLVTPENVNAEIVEHLDILPGFVNNLSLTIEELQERDEERKKTGIMLKNYVDTLEQKNKELQQAQLELKNYAAELERSNQELENFASVASHDMREPLRKIQIFGDRLQAKYGDVLDDRGRNYLARMQSSSARMQTFVEDLLAYSRLSAKTPEFEATNLNLILQDILEDIRFYIQESNAEIIFDELPFLEANPAQIRQLLQNLVTNAIKFQRPGANPIIHITSRAINDKLIEIKIVDNGIGFEPEYAERIFGMFQRLHGRSTYEGTGIGLAICRKIVEQHHGKITAVSQPNQGATFIITLPKTQNHHTTHKP